MENLAKAIIAVMQEIKGIEKEMTVGEGRNSYKGVSDHSVKQIIGNAMAKNGLCILPTGITPKTRIDRWTEIDQYSKVSGATKEKQSVFTEVETTYTLLHTSGESMSVSGYGHGTDPQDKGAGKATTYALKYTLLYLFLVPTGKIDDADNTHSEAVEIPIKQKPVLDEKHPKWNGAIVALQKGETSIEKISKVYSISEANKELLVNSIMDLTASV